MSQLPTKQEQRDESPLLEQQTMCRLCSNMDEKLISFYSEEGISCQLVDKINTYLPFKVSIDDNLPLQSCINCTSKILTWHQFLIDAVDWDQKLRNVVPAQDKVEIEIDNESLDQLYCPEPSTPEGNVETNKYKCEKCGNTFKRISSYNRHIRNHLKPNNKGATCEFCNKVISRCSDLKRHQKTCRENKSNTLHNLINIKNKSCKQCDASFAKISELRKHIEEEHDMKKIRIRRRQEEIDPSWFCDVCKKGYTRKYDMMKHRQTAHFDNKEIETKNVPEKQQRKKNIAFLKKCKVKNAEGKLAYECDVCKKTFPRSFSMMRHKTIHTGIRSYFCHLCGKSFRVAYGLTRHINDYHHKIRKFSCEFCDKCFFTNGRLKEHLNIHNNTRPYSCDVCSKSFKQRSTLFIHKKYHTDNFPFVCGVCGKKYRMSRELQVHSWLHTGLKPHGCHKCTATFRLAQDLKRHLKVHEKLQECVCEECGLNFTQDRYLKLHRKIHKAK